MGSAVAGERRLLRFGSAGSRGEGTSCLPGRLIGLGSSTAAGRTPLLPAALRESGFYAELTNTRAAGLCLL